MPIFIRLAVRCVKSDDVAFIRLKSSRYSCPIYTIYNNRNTNRTYTYAHVCYITTGVSLDSFGRFSIKTNAYKQWRLPAWTTVRSHPSLKLKENKNCIFKCMNDSYVHSNNNMNFLFFASRIVSREYTVAK